MTDTDTPARQVLNTQELANIIVRFLNEPGEGSKDRLRALGSVTTVNWAFFHASTDELWYRLPSVLPALHLLPGNCQFEKLANDGDPWDRFRVYQYKIVALHLSKDLDGTIEKHMSTFWFSFLLNLPSRPTVLFPKLAKLAIDSLASLPLTGIVPFLQLPALETVAIADLSDAECRYAAREEGLIELFLGIFAHSSSQIQRLLLNTPLKDKFFGTLRNISTLSEIRITLASPVTAQSQAFLCDLPRLKTLVLLQKCTGGAGILPGVGENLKGSYPGRSNISTLETHTEGYSAFWAAWSFSSPALRILNVMLNPKSGCVESVLLIPHILDILMRRAPNLEELRFWFLPDSPSDIWPRILDFLQNNPKMYPPNNLLQNLSALQHLTVLSIIGIPFVQTNFVMQILTRLHDLPRLRTLILHPRIIPAYHARDSLIVPTLSSLYTLSRKCPSLKNISLSLDLSIITQEVPDDSISNHGLERLFIFTNYRDLDIAEYTSLATYLDYCFPHIKDMTSFFTGQDPQVKELKALWTKTFHLIKSYQALRQRLSKSHKSSSEPSS